MLLEVMFKASGKSICKIFDFAFYFLVLDKIFILLILRFIYVIVVYKYRYIILRADT